MRIAQVAPLYESVPPRGYGGTERVVHWLVDELVRRGHDVTLYAADDSRTSARLVGGCGPHLGLDRHPCAGVSGHLRLAEAVARAADTHDVVHFHGEWVHFPIARRLGVPTVTTLHGRLDFPGVDDLLGTYDDLPVVSISDAQRRPIRRAAWAGTVHHGLPRDLHGPGGGGGYLVFLGRISPDKGPATAIAIARRVGLPLRIAAKVDQSERAYFESTIRPLLGGDVEFLGEVDTAGKQALLCGAAALLFPIAWPEPFGLVMIEAMACGTPVVAFRAGSVPEVVDDGVSGFVVDDADGAVEAVRRLDRLDRAVVRATFERRFTVERMADDYVAIYAALAAGADAAGAPAPSPALV